MIVEAFLGRSTVCVHTHTMCDVSLLSKWPVWQKVDEDFMGFRWKQIIRQTTLIFKIIFILIKRLKTLIQIYELVLNLLLIQGFSACFRLSYKYSNGVIGITEISTFSYYLEWINFFLNLSFYILSCIIK